ncbi:hypothetical protein CVT24_008988 [Panaeolus cyanescens]|uniref:Hydrophobin n=1 Tax=Panaeolus cyanescens TaxID=181874 RepID=A0A409YAP8_9AGAR|nr:hypothetical protein CVT24_008988 [Panaeolus cyanescens]
MKFTHALAVVSFALPLLAGATELEPRDACPTGRIRCCRTVRPSHSPGLAQTLSDAGLFRTSIASIGSIGGLVGLSCLPLSVVALTGHVCSTTPVCCTRSFLGGTVQAGCTTIIV